jgi:hypothetical protein
MTNRDTVAQLYTPIYDEFMLSTFGEETQVHPQIYQTIEDSTKEYIVDGLSGLGRWVAATEGSGGGYEDPVLDYSKTLTQAKFWKKFQVSFEAVDQDEYALLKKEEDAKAIGRGARDKVEYDTAQKLATGFSTAGPDGQYVFDTDHPKNREETGVTYDNLLSGAFSFDNLELAETQIAANYFDLKGIPIVIPDNALVVYPPALRGNVQRVLDERAKEQPGTALRNTNRFAGTYKAVEWRYLSLTLGGSNTAWYIIFPGLGFLKIVWSAKPHFTAWVDEDNEYYKFKGRMLYDCGVCNWRLGFASTGL